MEKLTLADLDVPDKRVLMRVDFNVPLSKDGQITDDSRIVAALPSIRYVIEQGGSLILMSHLGRPEGKVEKKFSLAPCAKRLSELLKKPVSLAPDCVGDQVEKMAKSLRPGDVILLENLRFHEAEEHPEKDPTFASLLAKLGDVYVDDAFGAAHRSHSSITAVATFFPQKAAAGFLMEKEIQELGNLLHNPKRPFYAIIGGAKVSSKAGAIEKLISHIDALFIGGAMAYTFLKVNGMPIGESLFEAKEEAVARQILSACKAKKISCHLPLDLVIADAFSNEAKSDVVSTQKGIPDGWQGMGIGPKTVEAWSAECKKASTIFWNGPLSAFEMPRFAKSTFAIAEFLSHLPATIVVGGGDSVAAIEKQGLGKAFTHLSTGGGASLEFLEQGRLPGVDALSNK